MRADEYYYRLDKIILKIKENSDKIITSNIFFRKEKMYKYHISDHIIGGETENIRKMFNNTKTFLEEKRTPKYITNSIPEQWLTMCYLLSIYTERDIKNLNSKELMIKHFDIIRLQEFEDFIISYLKKKVYGIGDLKSHKIIDLENILEI